MARWVRTAAAIGPVLLMLASLGLVGWETRQSQAHGFDDIDYVHLRADIIRPGGDVSQPLSLQSGSLSQVAFLYSYTGSGQAMVHVTVQAAGLELVDQRLFLARTPSTRDIGAWWEGAYWQSFAQLASVAVQGGAEHQVVVRIQVPIDGQPVTLYWSPPADHGLPSAGDSSKRWAVRAEYGPVKPVLLKVPVFVERISRYGAPWLPGAALWLLAIVMLAITAYLAVQLAMEDAS